MTDQEQEHTVNADNQHGDENGQSAEAQTDVVTTNDESAEEASDKVERSMKRGKTIGVSYSASRDSDEYRRHMSNALQNGEVPKVIMEAYNLIPYGEDDNADKVLGYVQGILDKLAMASTNKPCPPLRLFLSDTNDVNAFVLTEAAPPVLVVSLGLWDMLIENGYGEDHLAAILGHERFHLRRHEKWQD
ncbi:MAG: M48 family metalloprotease, partial [Pseudomonadota bacterium]|nr:M48 family metalloprotease [Pseudomonadota bacterium]